MSDASTIEVSILGLLKGQVRLIGKTIAGEDDDITHRMASRQNVSPEHVKYNLIMSRLNVIDSIRLLLDHQDHGFSSSSVTFINALVNDAYDIAKPVIDTHGINEIGDTEKPKNGRNEYKLGRLFNPPHPGALLFHQQIEDEDGKTIASLSAAAFKLGIEQSKLEELLGEKEPITAEIAVKLESSGAGSAEVWLGMQNQYDLFQLRNPHVESESN